jgi:hypothetical protein
MLDMLLDTGKVAKLPLLGAAELFTLGALAHPLIDTAALRWWNTQPDQADTALQGYDHLVRRGMIDPATGRIHPQLGVILAGRARPAFILLIRARPDSDPAPGRYLGIADEAEGLRAVRGEAPAFAEREDTGPVYAYELSSPVKAADLLATFAAERNRLVFDLYLPGSQTGLPSQRFAVSRGPRRLRAELTVPSVPSMPPRQVTCSTDDLAGLLLDSMKEACR